MRRFAFWLILSLVLLSGCTERTPVEPRTPQIVECVAVAEAPLGPSPALMLDPLFAEAGTEFGVPAPLLAAIGYVETRWQMVVGQPELGLAPAYGVMALRGESLSRGAALAGVSVEAARADARANIRAAAALLRAHAGEMGLKPMGLTAWAPVVARFSGIGLEEGRDSYVHDGVYAVLRRGATATGSGGETIASVAPATIDPRLLLPRASLQPSRLAPPDQPGALWRPSPNQNQRPTGDTGRTTMVIIHTCEGAYAGCWSWLVNAQSGVSAHYVVNEDGSEVSQLVEEERRAWHIGASYRCSLNVGLDCWRNDQQSNHFTIGIEHAGYAAQTSFPAGQIETSTRLVCEIARRRGIPIDHLRIAAHGQLQPENRTDPGPNWPWAEYIAGIRLKCGGAGANGPTVVDDGDPGDPALSSFQAPGWTASSATRGYFGRGYAFAGAGAGEPASFSFYNPAAGPRTVGAWWTAGTNRAPRTPFVALAPDGRELGRVEVSQKSGGSRWNTLGTWSFPAGWNRIQVSRGGDAGCVVVADGIVVN